MEIVQARAGLVPKPTSQVPLRHSARVSDLCDVRAQGMTGRQQRPDLGHEAAAVDLDLSPFRIAVDDEVRPESPTLGVDGLEPMYNASRHHDSFACLDDLTSFANAK